MPLLDGLSDESLRFKCSRYHNGISFVADFIFSLSRTTEDKAANKGKIFIAKNRHGPDGLIYEIFMDTSCVKIDVLQETTAPTAKEQGEKIKNIYKNMKKERGK